MRRTTTALLEVASGCDGIADGAACDGNGPAAGYNGNCLMRRNLKTDASACNYNADATEDDGSAHALVNPPVVRLVATPLR